MLKLSDILERVSAYHPSPDLDVIKKAYVYSAKVHQGQVRMSGEPYLIHPLEVAGILAELKLDEASIVTGLLHDTIEDTLATREELRELFGEEVEELVDGVTKLSQFSATATISQEEKQAENFRKMIVAMARDIRVILVKLADRTHNMRTLEHMTPEKQQRIAQETLDIYAPLANRLGISWVKVELEDLAFKYLRPVEYAELATKIESRRKERDKYVEDVIAILKTRMDAQGLESRITGRMKHLYSVYRKMKSQNISFEQVHDTIAFRIIVKSVSACYEALGYVHSQYKPVPGRFKDFIAIPKPNMYQSLHTTVIGPYGERVEIQIRTEEMHRIAEEGIAAHWAYKEGRDRTISKDDEKFAWLRQLMEWQKDLKDPKEFLETVKVDLFTDEVFVFTPKGEVRSLPRGASPVDFAYSIHGDVGDRCVGAKINGKIVPLRYKLKNGDTVEILTSPLAHPNKDWLTFVRTSRAQAKVRRYIKQTEREKSLELGREILDKELRRFGQTLQKVIKTGELAKVAEHLGLHGDDGLIAAVGYGRIQLAQVIPKLVAADVLEKVNGGNGAAHGVGRIAEIIKKVANRPSKTGVRISGIDDVMLRFGRCCNPVPGDRIVGFITRGRGITVHTLACEKVLSTDPERRVDVSWDVQGDFKRPVTVRVLTIDRPGLLADISATFSGKGVNISQANCRSTGDDRAVNTFEVAISDVRQLNDCLKAIGRIQGVFSAERV